MSDALNRLAKVEAQLEKKFGKEAVRHIMSKWDDDKEENYQKQITDIYRKEEDDTRSKIIEIDTNIMVHEELLKREGSKPCEQCGKYIYMSEDGFYVDRYGVCQHCYIMYVEDREENWLKRRNKKEEKNNES